MKNEVRREQLSDDLKVYNKTSKVCRLVYNIFIIHNGYTILYYQYI